MNTLEALRAGRKKIENPAHWWDGGQYNPLTQFCAITACPDHVQVWDALSTACADFYGGNDFMEWGHSPIQSVNDEFGHPYVMAMYDRAIEIEEAKQAEWDAPITAEFRADEEVPVA